MCCLPAEADNGRGVAIPQAQKAHYNPFAAAVSTEQQRKPLKHQGKRIDGESSSPFSSACPALMLHCHCCYAPAKPVRVRWGGIGLHLTSCPIVLLHTIRALRDFKWLLLKCRMPLADILAGLSASGKHLTLARSFALRTSRRQNGMPAGLDHYEWVQLVSPGSL